MRSGEKSPLQSRCVRLKTLLGSSIEVVLEIENRKCMLLVDLLQRLWGEDDAQDIAEYAVMLAIILVIVVGTIRLIGSNSNNVFSSVSSSLQ